MSEAGIHFDFYFHLRSAIEGTPRRGQRTYDRAEPEYSQDLDRSADLVLFDTTDGPVVVIEAKRPSVGVASLRSQRKREMSLSQWQNTDKSRAT